MNEAEVRVDYASIEKSLTELWRTQNQEGEQAVMRAALWNVVAHTCSPKDQARASEILSRAAASVPQRTIVVRSQPDEKAEIAAWISANCHLVGGEKQVCSEEIAVVAGGEAIHRIAPLVRALLLPDMPVAIWWLGDLPGDRAYVKRLLESSDRLIVDSSQFNSAADLDLLSEVTRNVKTSPADLNWIRLEQWRSATAAVFDPPEARRRLSTIRAVRLVSTATAGSRAAASFGDSTESLLFAAWLSAQSGHRVHSDGRVESAAGPIHYELKNEPHARDFGSLSRVEIEFSDGKTATITRDDQRHVIVAALDGKEHTLDCVTRMRDQDVESLIVRLLKRPGSDRVFGRALPIAASLASRVAA